jgi:type IV pilus assembly protein PilB
VAKRIGELLVEAGVLSQSQLEQALFAQRKDGRKLGQLLIELGLVSEIQLTQTLSRQLAVPWVSLYHVDFSRSLLNLVAREAAEKYCLVPIFVRRVRKQGETLYVAMDDPTNEAAIEEVSRAAALAVKPMIACPSDIRAAIRVYYLGETAVPPPPASAMQTGPQVPAPVASLGPRPAPPPPPAGLRSPAGDVPPGEPIPPPRLKMASIPETRVEPPPESRAPETARIADSRSPETRRVESRPPPGKGPPNRTAEGKAPEGPRERPEAPDPSAERAPRRMRPRMISLTLLDGTSIQIPTPGKKQPSTPDAEGAARPREPVVNDQLTARDLVSALRAASHGVDVTEILGGEPRWEALFSALLSVLLRKGIIADWEFIEEFRKL